MLAILIEVLFGLFLVSLGASMIFGFREAAQAFKKGNRRWGIVGMLFAATGFALVLTVTVWIAELRENDPVIPPGCYSVTTELGGTDPIHTKIDC